MRPNTDSLHTHRRFYFLLGLLLCLILIRYALQIAIPRFMFTVIVILAALIGDPDEVVAVLICCIPIHESIDFFYTLGFWSMVFVFRFWKRMRINIIVIPVALMLIWELLHCFSDNFSVMELLTYFIPMLVLVLVMSIQVETLDYPFIVRSFSISMLATCLCVFVKLCYLYDFNFILVAANLQRLGHYSNSSSELLNRLNITGGDIQVNTLGILCVLAVACLMQLRNTRQHKKGDISIMVFLLLFGTLTSSRTFLVCLAFMILLLFFSQKGSFNQKIGFLSRIVLLLLVVLLFMWIFFPDVLLYFISRFDTDDITTGRIDIGGQYHNFIISSISHLFFGIGLQSFAQKVTETLRIASVVPHNMFQEIVVAWGLPGLLLFLSFLALMIDGAHKRSHKQRLLNYIPLLIILLKSQAGQFLRSSYTMLTLSLIYLSLCTDLSDRRSIPTSITD